MADKAIQDDSPIESKFSPSFDLDGIPVCLHWSAEEVAEWISFLGFPQYKACFTENIVNGRKLISIHASSLPRVGITDFEHIKFIAKKIRDLLGLEEPEWNRSKRLQPCERLGLFLEKRSQTGLEADSITYADFQRQLDKLELHRPYKRVGYPTGYQPKS